MLLTLDSSVIVAALRAGEKEHDECMLLLERVKEGHFMAVEPFIVLVEVVAAIKRRTGSVELSERVKRDLERFGSMYFFELTGQRAGDAAELAVRTGMRGMDAIIAQVAIENGSVLVSLDKELVDKARGVVNIKNLKDLV